jgi:ATP-dependent DNA helicase RecQ
VPDWVAAPVEEDLAAGKRRKRRIKAAPVGQASRPAAGPQPSATPARPQSVAPSPQRDLIDFFKEWRRNTAQRASVPAYIVLSDAAVEDLCRKRPSNLRELLDVSGIGERKAELYGSEIFAAFEAFRNGARAAAREADRVAPAEETIRLLALGKTFEEIAQIRGRQVSTVVNMVAGLVEQGSLEYRVEWVGEETHRVVEEAVRRLGAQWLKPLREALPAEITYDQIRLVVAYVRAKS